MAVEEQYDTKTPVRAARGGVALALLIVANVATASATLSLEAREAKGAGAVVLMLTLIALRIPVGIAMIAASAFGIGALTNYTVIWNTAKTQVFATVASWPLTVVPMFVLLGMLLWESGTSRRAFEASRQVSGRLPGALGLTANLSGTGLGAVSGSSVAICYALGRISIPELLKNNYDPRLAIGSVLAAGSGGGLIPPSILLVLYAGIATTPVGPQLLAGLVPGLILATGYALLIVGIAWLRPQYAPVPERDTRPLLTRLRIVFDSWPIAALIFIVVGGIAFGYFTPTEAGAAGAFAAAVITYLFVPFKQATRAIGRALVRTAAITAAIMLLIVGSTLMIRMLSLSRLPTWISDVVGEMGLSRVTLLLILFGVYLILGAGLDPMAMMLLTVPVLLPVVVEAGGSALWFGVFVVLMGELAILTPPVGFLGFVMHKVVQDPEVALGHTIGLSSVFRAAFWFLPIPIAVALALIFFPAFAEWLPMVSSAR